MQTKSGLEKVDRPKMKQEGFLRYLVDLGFDLGAHSFEGVLKIIIFV